MKKLICFLIVMVLLSSFIYADTITLIYADTITLKTYNFPHPTNEYGAWFEIPNVILIWNYDKLTNEEYNKLLVHEYTHYLCWELWKIHPQNHTRCFTGKGFYLID